MFLCKRNKRGNCIVNYIKLFFINKNNILKLMTSDTPKIYFWETIKHQLTYTFLVSFVGIIRVTHLRS